MPDIILNDISPRIQYTAMGGQTVFTYPFPIYANTDLIVYQTPNGQVANDATQVLTITVNYTVTNNMPPAVGGSITLNIGANAGDIITIIRDMPQNRLVNYLDGGQWSATQFNTDFDRTVMMSQTDKMYTRVVAPHYDTSTVVNTNQGATSSVDLSLPILPANCIWMKNNANTGIVAVAIANAGGTGATVILPTVVNSIATFNNTSGTLQSSLGTIDGAGNIGVNVVNAQGGVVSYGGSPVAFHNATNTATVNFSAQAATAINSSYQWPLTTPAISGANLTSNAAGILNWQLNTFTAIGTLTNAQLLGMYANPVPLLNSPGAGNCYIVKSFYLEVVFNVASFANGGVIILEYGNVAHGAGTNTISNGGGSTIAAAFLTGAAANQFQMLFSVTNIGTTAPTNYTNQGIWLSNQTGPFTNAAGGLSTANYAIEYMIVPMT